MPSRVVETPIGPLRLVAGRRRSWRSSSTRGPRPSVSVAPILDQAGARARRYFGGGRRTFHGEARTGRHAFQHRVWEALSRVPYGTVELQRPSRERSGRRGGARGRRGERPEPHSRSSCRATASWDRTAISRATAAAWREQWLRRARRRRTRSDARPLRAALTVGPGRRADFAPGSGIDREDPCRALLSSLPDWRRVTKQPPPAPANPIPEPRPDAGAGLQSGA